MQDYPLTSLLLWDLFHFLKFPAFVLLENMYTYVENINFEIICSPIHQRVKSKWNPTVKMEKLQLLMTSYISTY